MDQAEQTKRLTDAQSRDEGSAEEAVLTEQEKAVADGETDEGGASAADGAAPEQDELERLRARISELEGELAERTALSERVERECGEFEQYFPRVSLRHVPDVVWRVVHAGVPLAAAYALYEKKKQLREQLREQRRQSSEAQTPHIESVAQKEYFSPSQVRAMSQREVRENYDRIFESMRHWQ